MPRIHRCPSSALCSVCLAAMFLIALFYSVGDVTVVHAECFHGRNSLCMTNGDVASSAMAGGAGIDLYVPPSMTLVFSDTFVNEPYIIGPGPGVLMIDDVTIDGHLVISNGAQNYGPVYVNGRLSTSGAWHDASEGRYACDPMRGFCVDSEVHGYVTNRSLWQSDGEVLLPFGLTNDGQWRNAAVVDADGVVVNRGQMTNTGIITLTGVMRNLGEAHNPGLLVNRGELYNWGRMTGSITNDGVIYSMGVLSATIEGDGPVHLLTEAVYLPHIRR